MTTPRSLLGARGEEIARRALEANGFRYVESNWRCAAGELDLVMWDDDELAFVEVKLRRGDRSGTGEDAVTPTKRRRLLAAASWYIEERCVDANVIWRIDLVAITLERSGRVASMRHSVNAVLDG